MPNRMRSAMIPLIFKRLWPLRPEWIFLAFGIPFGAALVFLVPPLQTPDEQVHLYRAYQVASGEFHPERRGDEVGGVLPRSLLEFERRFLGIRFIRYAKVDTEVLLSSVHLPLAADDKVFVGFPSSATYAPTMYVGQAIGIKAAAACGAGPLVLLWSARCFNLLIYLLLSFLAIRWLPIQRWAMVAVALMPMAVHQAASASPDAATMGSAFLFVALAARLALGDETHAFSPWWLLPVGLFASLCKVNALLLPLVFLVPARRFQRRWSYGAWLAVMMVAGVSVLMLWQGFTADAVVPSEPGVEHPRHMMQLILTHPSVFARALWTFWSDGAQVLTIGWCFIGCFGWLDAPLPFPMMLLYAAGLLGVAVVEPAAHAVNGKQRAMLAGLFALSVLGISACAFMMYSTVGHCESVYGIQGRYFIPFAPLVVLCASNRHGGRVFPAVLIALLLIITLAIAATMHTIMLRFYYA